MAPSFLSIVDALAALAVIILVCRILSRKSAYPLPPGPRRWPVIGNLLDLPPSHSFIHWAKYKSIYGPISSLSVFGQKFVILNDQRTCVELLEKRSANYAERPVFAFANMCVVFTYQNINLTTTRTPNGQFVEFLQTGQVGDTERPSLVQATNSTSIEKAHIKSWAPKMPWPSCVRRFNPNVTTLCAMSRKNPKSLWSIFGCEFSFVTVYGFASVFTLDTLDTQVHSLDHSQSRLWI